MSDYNAWISQDDNGSTHYEGCWKHHPICAAYMAELIERDRWVQVLEDMRASLKSKGWRDEAWAIGEALSIALKRARG